MKTLSLVSADCLYLSGRIIARLLLCSLLGSILLSGCASFSDATIENHRQKIAKGNLSQVAGMYQLAPDLEYKNDGKARSLDNRNFAKDIHFYISQKTSNLDSAADMRLIIKQYKIDQLTFIVKQNSLTLDSLAVPVKFYKGSLYLQNKSREYIGIPYLFGSIMTEKTRIGLAKDEGLIIHYLSNSSGALLFMFFGSNSYQKAYHLKKLKP